MEVWDCYDRNRNKLGKTMVRGSKRSLGDYHIVVDAYIMSNDHKFLVTKRSPTKKHYPNYFEVPGGSILQGETSVEGVIREVVEETGIVLKKEEGELIYSTRREFNQSFQDIYLFKHDVALEEIVLQVGETCQACLLSIKEIEKLFLENKFVDTIFTREIQIALKKHCP